MNEDFNKIIIPIIEKKEKGFALVSTITQIDETNAGYDNHVTANCNIKDIENILYHAMLSDSTILFAAVNAVDRFIESNGNKKCDEDCANCKDNYSPIRN